MTTILLALIGFTADYAEKLAQFLPLIDPAQVPKEDLDKFLCDIHAADTAIECFRIHAEQVTRARAGCNLPSIKPTPTQEA